MYSCHFSRVPEDEGNYNSQAGHKRGGNIPSGLPEEVVETHPFGLILWIGGSGWNDCVLSDKTEIDVVGLFAS